MVDNEICFAFIKRGKTNSCAILHKPNCEKCSFFKTREEFQKGLVKYPPDPFKFVPRNK